mmetsp:Transcript_2989/g.4639  ORF Transcript_2989/g.4639 Transcript_2989/m.4639 type:complete len:118 (+) Transcript_2989:110-463(+)
MCLVRFVSFGSCAGRAINQCVLSTFFSQASFFFVCVDEHHPSVRNINEIQNTMSSLSSSSLSSSSIKPSLEEESSRKVVVSFPRSLWNPPTELVVLPFYMILIHVGAKKALDIFAEL